MVTNVRGVVQVSGPLIVGSSRSAASMKVTQVRLWRSAIEVPAFYQYMIDPASVESGQGADLLAYYPFSGASKLSGPSESAFSIETAGCERSTRAPCDGSTKPLDLDISAHHLIEAIPFEELFLDVYHF